MTKLCDISDLIENSGVCALVDNNDELQQIALFYLPDTEQQIFALSNWDPCGNANVMSRGIIGNIGDEMVIASPLYKQHFSLKTGQCTEDEQISLITYPIEIKEDGVYLAA